MIRRWMQIARARRTLAPGEAVSLSSEDYSDPRRDAEIDRLADRFVDEERGIVAALRADGMEITTVGDLQDGRAVREHVPVLAEWLGRVENVDVKEVIVRALGTRPHGRLAVEALLRELRDVDAPRTYRWAVGDALAAQRDRTIAPELVAVLRDPRQGIARQTVAEALGRTGDPVAFGPLVEALADPEVAGHAAQALGLLGDPAARPHLEPLRSSSTPWVRNAATQAFERLGR